MNIFIIIPKRDVSVFSLLRTDIQNLEIKNGIVHEEIALCETILYHTVSYDISTLNKHL